MTTNFIYIRSSLLELFLSLQLIFYLKCVRCEGRILTLLRLNLHDCVNFHHQNRNISAFFAHFICHYCTSQSGINQPFSVIPECLPHLRMMTPPLRPTLRGGEKDLIKRGDGDREQRRNQTSSHPVGGTARGTTEAF